MDTALAPTAEIRQEAEQALVVAKDFKIVSNTEYESAGERLKGIKGLMKRIAETFDPIIAKAHAAHREAVQQKKNHEAPLLQAEGIYKRALLGYQQEQECKRREEQARLEEAARKEREKLEAKAEKMDAKGKTEQAEDLRLQAATVATPVVSVNTPKVAGVSTRKVYSVKVVDKMVLIRAVAEGKVPENAVIENMVVLNALARTLKEGFNYSGCELVASDTLASRGD